MAVDRCYCHGVPFILLKDLAEIWGPDLDRLSQITGCGTGCGMCRPYIRLMLETGKTDLPVLSSESFDRMMREELTRRNVGNQDSPA